MPPKKGTRKGTRRGTRAAGSRLDRDEVIGFLRKMGAVIQETRGGGGEGPICAVIMPRVDAARPPRPPAPWNAFAVVVLESEGWNERQAQALADYLAENFGFRPK